ncbi:MAG: acyltransferase [Hyphomicrobiales bacterium]|nr:acyltransferase [Hyphomicrobiales bacterium]
MKYRPDIDGLRAVAVIPIVLYHAGVSQISGGFIGVDVFFVISGYLITSILIGDVAAGRFSIVGFWGRRIVRIFPALFAMLAAVLVFGAATLFPGDLRSLAKSAAAAAAFVSNVWFEFTTGYFGQTAETMPLLHTWSLGVEDQFYIVHPLLIAAVHRFAPARLKPILVGTALVSLALGFYLSVEMPVHGFYGLPGRIWELGLGALVAAGATPRLMTKRARDLASLAGLGLIGLALVLVRPTSLFPVPWALLPAVGAALLLAYGEGAVTTRLLSTATLRFVGAISYSLYLWHWPIITFWRLRFDMKLAPSDTAAVVALSLAAAWLSHRFVERPAISAFRSGRPGRLVVAGLAGVGAISLAAFVAAIGADHWRAYPPDVLKVAGYSRYEGTPEHRSQFLDGTCFVSLGEVYQRKACLPVSTEKPNLLVFGDSHAAQYWLALKERFPTWNVMQATGAACRPMHGVSTEGHCNDFVPYILDDFLAKTRIDAVILAGRWLDGEDAILEGTIRTLKDRGLHVTVIGPVVEYEGEFPAILADAMMRGDADLAARKRLMERLTRDRQMAPMVKATGATWVSAWDAECPEGKCRLFDTDGGPMHFDYGHVTLSAARLLMQAVPEPRQLNR